LEPRVTDILYAIAKIERYTEGRSFETFRSDDMVVDATVWNLVVVGEAAANVPIEVQRRYPDVAWIRMRGMRNVAVHRYFELDLDVVWDTVQSDLPLLVTQLHEIIANE
jgi:uncharacterized protein with HEPN domain